MENVCFCSSSAFALVSGFTITVRIGSVTARPTAVLIGGKSKAETLDSPHLLTLLIGAGKHVIREDKSRQIDREYLTRKNVN